MGITAGVEDQHHLLCRNRLCEANPSCGFGAGRSAKEESAFMGRLSAFCISGQTWRSYVGILHRMPKPGSFASLACTLSEHLRARPKHLHLQGPACFGIISYIERLSVSACPLREGGSPKGRGWICPAGAESAKQNDGYEVISALTHIQRLRRRRKRASSAPQKPPLRGGSILRLCRGPSPRACMIGDRVTLRFKVLRLCRNWNPNDSAHKT